MRNKNGNGFSKSLQMLERAKAVIPCATQSLSKGYTQWSVGAAPLFVDSASGCRVVDVDGNTYIDYSMALGLHILGYGDPDVNEAVRKQLEKGTLFTLPHSLETEAAELIVKSVPCAEMVRFGKNGSDATSAAIKVVRAYSGKEKIITCGYHGWQDWYIAITERNRGIPKGMRDFILPMRYNSIDSLEKIISEHHGEIAALIMEPIAIEPPKDGFLKSVREITRKNNILLIFDEMFTGFRWSLGGAQEYFNVIPDLACFGKAIGNGFPVSVVTGRRDVMKEFEDVFFSLTYGGEALSLAAIVATIHKLKEEKVHNHIWNIGAELKNGIEALIIKHDLTKYLSINGHSVKTGFSFIGADVAPLEMKTYFQQECAERGVLFIGYHLPSFAHKKEDINLTLEVYDEVMGNFRKVVREKRPLKNSLRGSVVTQIFKDVGDRSIGLNPQKGVSK